VLDRREPDGTRRASPPAKHFVLRIEMPLRFLAYSLAQFVQFRAQTMPQRALGPKFVEQLLGFGKSLVRASSSAEQASPRTGNLLFSQQNNTSYIG
jgi:hypothetical protein